YPAGAGQVAVTSGVASLFDLHIGDTWHLGGRARRVTGLVENPANLRDQFALVAPGQVTAPAQVTVLFDARRRATARCRQDRLHPPGGARHVASQPSARNAPPSLTPAAPAVRLAVLRPVFR